MKRYEVYTFLCNCLSIDFHPEMTSTVEKQMSSGVLEWEKILSLASKHLIIQIIYRIYKENQLLEMIPEDVVSEMKRIHSLVEVRNQEMLTQSAEINTILSKIGIHPIFLKGMGYLMHGLYKDNTDRILADVDFLINIDSIEAAAHELKNSGFTTTKELNPKKIPNLKHYPRLFKPGSMVSFEMHWEPVKAEYREHLNYNLVSREVISPSNSPELFTMSWKQSIQHNFLHSQLEHKVHTYAKVHLRNIYDFALLSEKGNISESLSSLGKYKKQAASYILLTENTFNLKNLSSEADQKEASKFFHYHHELNLHYRTPHLIFLMLFRIYHSYIRKFFRIFFDKDLRKVIFKHLSSKSWYKHHLNTYRRMFGKAQK